jgi:LmbE family N-acetylglucosaminyl deacetylase
MHHMTVVVLSPHFDDAVLSCWHVLRRPESVLVVNIFAGAPSQGSPPGWWDQQTGAPDPRARVGERANEDQAALRLAGRAAVNLDMLEAQHRRRAPSVTDIAGRLAEVVPECDTLYAPAGIGGHVDHALVRDVACATFPAQALRLYADLPHAIRRGWPTWVTPDGDAAVDGDWAGQLAERRELSLRPRVHALGPEEQERKLVAVRSYRTQIAELQRMSFGPLERVLGYEVTWDVALA